MPGRKRWKDELANRIKTIDGIKKYTKLSPDEEKILPEVVKKFQMAVTPYYASLIDKNDVDDPIKRIVVPSVEELESSKGWYDTSGEATNTKVRGMQHKYSSTAVLLPTPLCASFCRYCFRKRITIAQDALDETHVDWDKAFVYLREHKEINNVLVTGGDPLFLSNEKLEFIIGNLRKIDHIGVIRIGTKFPAFNPFRLMDQGFLDMISKYSLPDKKIYIVSHFDHPRELSTEALECIDKTIRAGTHWINQATLYKGVNDNPEVLRELIERLTAAGVAPYYVFQMRPIKGSMHRRVTIKEGVRIFSEARKGLSGLARRARYIMSHYTGKMELVGITNGGDTQKLILKYMSNRDEKNVGRIVIVNVNDDGYWLEDFIDKKLNYEDFIHDIDAVL